MAAIERPVRLPVPQAVVWQAAPAELAGQIAFFGRALWRWELTPYKARSQSRGKDGGVDCVRFVAAIFDELRGKQTAITTLPDDAALHNRKSAIAAMWQLVKALGPNVLLQPVDGHLYVQPGDVLVTGPIGGGAGHAIFVGPERNVFWEASGTGVRRVGLYALRREGTAVYYAFSPTDRAQWPELPGEDETE